MIDVVLLGEGEARFGAYLLLSGSADHSERGGWRRRRQAGPLHEVGDGGAATDANR